jgi:predicted dehydrogenase
LDRGVKILVAGLGSIGQRHVRNLRALLGEELELLAFRSRRTSPLIHADLSADPDTPLEEAYGLRAFDDLDAALAEQPDAVFVTNPNSLHVPVALAAARAGCHLFIEKPISHDLDGVPDLIAEIEARSLVCLVAYQFRFDPGFRLLRRLLDESALGTPIAANAVFGESLPGWHPYEDYRQFHVARSDQGGGVLLAQIHDLDLVHALFGMPRRVFALGGKLSRLELDVEDTASVLLDCRIPVHLHQDLVQRPKVRRYEVIGEDGTASWDQVAGTLVVRRPDRDDDVTSFAGLERNQLFLDELRHFLACLTGDERPVVDARAGAESLRIAVAAKQSLETGEVVTLG